MAATARAHGNPRRLVGRLSAAIGAWVVPLALVAACGPTSQPAPATTAPSATRPAAPAASAAAASAPPAVPASSPAAAASGGNPWRIAVVGPYTGNLAQVGKDYKTAADLYVNQQNERGGWGGRKIEIEYVDEVNSDATAGATAAQKVAADASVLAVFGHFTSSSVLAAGPIYKKTQIPFLVTDASSPVITQQGNDWLFRTGPTAIFETRNGVDLMKQLGKSKIAIVYSDADFGKAQDEYGAKAIKAAGLQVVSETSFKPGAQDFSAIISKLKDQQPDCVWLGMYDSEAGPFVKQAKAAGFQATIAGSGAFLTDNFLKLAGPAAEGVYVDGAPIAVQAQNAPATADFLKAYRDAYHTDPDNFAQEMYSDFQLVGESIAAGAHDRQTLRDTLAKKQDFKNAVQITSFDATGDGQIAERDISVVKNGKWTLFATYK